MTAGIKRINNNKGHWYKIDGVKADGVTTLISQGLPKPALTYWAARTVAEHVADHLDEVEAMRNLGRDAIVNALKGAPWTQRDEAAKRGTEVHKIAERLIAGEEVDVPEPIAGHVESCVRFLDDWRVRPVLVEATVAHRRWRYAGTLDVVADIAGDERALLDYKTSRSGIFPETCLQEAAYRYAEVYLDPKTGEEKPVSDLGITAVYGVWLRADGYDVIPLAADESAFRSFLHVATVARWAKDAKSLLGDAMTIPDTGDAA